MPHYCLYVYFVKNKIVRNAKRYSVLMRTILAKISTIPRNITEIWKKKTCAGIKLSNGRRCVEMQQQENATRDAQSATTFQRRPVPFVACSRRGREEWVSHTDALRIQTPWWWHTCFTLRSRNATGQTFRLGKRSTSVPETGRPFPFL